MLMLNVGIVIICSIIILFLFCFSLFRVLSGCCLVVVYLGGGMLFSVLYMYVGSECSIRDYFCVMFCLVLCVERVLSCCSVFRMWNVVCSHVFVCCQWMEGSQLFLSLLVCIDCTLSEVLSFYLLFLSSFSSAHSYLFLKVTGFYKPFKPSLKVN